MGLKCTQNVGRTKELTELIAFLELRTLRKMGLL